jgi:HEAT repeat protein
MHLEEARPFLQKRIGNDKATGEEKALAIMTLASLYEKVEPEELSALITSKRAGMRQLACELVAHLQLSVYAEDIAKLIRDHSPDVRMFALGALGFLPDVRIQGKPLVEVEAVHSATHDPIPSVAITAAWLLLRQGEVKAEEIFAKHLEEGQPEVRRMASAALATCGPHGMALSRKWLQRADDIYVRVNLALGLIGQRVAVDESCAVLQEALQVKSKGLWMWDETSHPLFRSLCPSHVRHIDQIPNYPLVVDQMVQLDLLSILSKLRYPHALDAIEGFLKKGQWSVIGSAAGVLLEEGDEAEIEVVRGLLRDSDQQVRIEAAFLLAYWGHDSAGIEELMAAYPEASRPTKIRILEALGKSGDPKAIPFLVDVLGEPFQVLRIVAASALIQCLYQ